MTTYGKRIWIARKVAIAAIALFLTALVLWAGMEQPYFRRGATNAAIFTFYWLLIPYAFAVAGLASKSPAMVSASFVTLVLHLGMLVAAWRRNAFWAPGHAQHWSIVIPTTIQMGLALFVFGLAYALLRTRIPAAAHDPPPFQPEAARHPRNARPSAIVAAVFALFVARLALGFALPSDAVRALPDSSANIQEYYSPSFSSYMRCVKATMSPDEVEAFAHRLGLKRVTAHTPDQVVPSCCNVRVAYAPPWWNPPTDAGVECYCRQDPDRTLDQSIVASDGNVYYLALNW